MFEPKQPRFHEPDPVFERIEACEKMVQSLWDLSVAILNVYRCHRALNPEETAHCATAKYPFDCSLDKMAIRIVHWRDEANHHLHEKASELLAHQDRESTD